MKRNLIVGFRCGLMALVMIGIVVTSPAEPPLYAQPSPPRATFSWLDEIRREVPALTHDRGDRWPMILWEAGPFEPQAPSVYKELLARGLTQHIHLDEKMIPTAQALRDAGSPVIMMEGNGGHVRMPASVSPDLASAIVRALVGR